MDCGSNLSEGEMNNLYDEVNALKGATVTQQAQFPTTFQPLVNQVNLAPRGDKRGVTR